MSARSEMFDRLVQRLRDKGLLTSPTAGHQSRLEKRGKPYSYTLGTSRWMDGEMIVYGESFIQFKIQGSPMNKGRRTDSYICKSEEDAIGFIDAMSEADKAKALSFTSD